MQSFTSIFLLATAALTAAQTIDPNSVPIATRQAWCVSQQSSCPLLCLQQSNTAATRSNTCVASSLAWTCVCANGISPNVTEYSLTIPFYQCQEWGNQCVKACGQDNTCSSNCREQHPCGAKNPTRINATSSSMTASATASGASASSTGAFGTFGGSGSSSSSSNSNSGTTGSKSNAVRLLDLGSSYGVVALAGGIFGAVALGL